MAHYWSNNKLECFKLHTTTVQLIARGFNPFVELMVEGEILKLVLQGNISEQLTFNNPINKHLRLLPKFLKVCLGWN